MYLLKFISKICEITSENLFLVDLSNLEPLCYAAYIGSTIIQLQDGWVTFGGNDDFFYQNKRGGAGTGKTQASLLPLDTYLTFFGGVVHIFVLFFFPVCKCRGSFTLHDGARLRKYKLKF